MRVAAAAALVLLTGCVRTVTERSEVTPDAVRSETELRTATNLPPEFAVLTPAQTPHDCPPRLQDAHLRTILTLHRAVLQRGQDSAGAGYRAIGDYAAVPAGLYGEEPGEGLRIDCGRLRALGVVRL